MHEPEPRTLRAAVEGDLGAFEEIVRAYQAPVWRFLRHLLGDGAQAEDVTQETFLRVYQKLAGFRYQSKFSTWVFQIARNAGIDALRARARHDRLVASLPWRRAAAGPESNAEVAAAVSSLSPKLREAVLLVEVLGLTYNEAADVLGIPEGTAKSRVFQARGRLTAWLDAGEAAASGGARP